MHDIFLICTRHENLGYCNSDELYNIFERIKPDVIFEETPPSYFDQYYVNKSRESLESVAILNYLQNYAAVNIPVDSNDVPDKSFFERFEKLHSRIEGLSGVNGFNYRNFTDRNQANIYNQGFKFINSEAGDYYRNEIRLSIEEGLKQLKNPELDVVYKDWRDVTNKREDLMLKNIYDYSSENDYNCAVFTIGSGHRRSVIQKILGLTNSSTVKLKWQNIGYHYRSRF